MSRITVSLVSYESTPDDLRVVFDALCASNLVQSWIVVDNAAQEDTEGSMALRHAVTSRGGQYVPAPANIGFGAGHNMALDVLDSATAEFHLMINPDIEMGEYVLPSLVNVMDMRPEVGRVMPRVHYLNGDNQFLCKLLPTPFDFAVRRFLPSRLQGFVKSYMDRYELRGLEDLESTSIPFLSGCFIFARRSLLQDIGGFDERYFLYMEDVDLCRRMRAVTKVLYWPHVIVAHGFRRGSHYSLILTLRHFWSAIRYFNRWGWFFDHERSQANRIATAERNRHNLTNFNREA